MNITAFQPSTARIPTAASHANKSEPPAPDPHDSLVRSAVSISLGGLRGAAVGGALAGAVALPSLLSAAAHLPMGVGIAGTGLAGLALGFKYGTGMAPFLMGAGPNESRVWGAVLAGGAAAGLGAAVQAAPLPVALAIAGVGAGVGLFAGAMVQAYRMDNPKS